MHRRSHAAWGDRAMLWLACTVALAAGFAVAGVQLNAAIDDTHERTAETLARIAAGTTLLAAAPDLERASHAADETLRTFDLHADASTLVARFIRSSAAISAEHRVRVDQIDQRPTSSLLPASADPGARAQPNALQLTAIPLEVGLSGSYRDLLATIAAVAQGPVAVRVTIASMERRAAVTTADRVDVLTAHLHVDVLRLPDLAPGAAAFSASAAASAATSNAGTTTIVSPTRTSRNDNPPVIPATGAAALDRPTMENTSHARPI